MQNTYYLSAICYIIRRFFDPTDNCAQLGLRENFPTQPVRFSEVCHCAFDIVRIIYSMLFAKNIFARRMNGTDSHSNDTCDTACQESFLIIVNLEKLTLIIPNLITQKQVVQRLRKEVETFKAENANGAKVSIATLLGLNNNNHITNNNETKLKTAGNEFSTKKSKEDYEEIVRNGDVPSPARNTVPAKWAILIKF